jgi:hypothetical protein
LGDSICNWSTMKLFFWWTVNELPRIYGADQNASGAPEFRVPRWRHPTSEGRSEGGDIRVPSSEGRSEGGNIRVPRVDQREGGDIRVPRVDQRVATSEFRVPRVDQRVATSEFRG